MRAGHATFAAFLAVLPATAQAQSYVRAGAGVEAGLDDRLRDTDCDAGPPAALFGCGPGVDGGELAARGGFGHTSAVELGLGRRISSYARIELAGAWRPGLDFDGGANFMRTPGEQRVSASASSLSLLATTYVDLGQIGRARPFAGLGAGLSRNRIGPVTYAFPGLGPAAETVAPGGAHTSFAWAASLGIAWTLTPRTTLDLAYRYADLGQIRTAAGPARISRSSGVRAVEVAPTRARLATSGFGVSIRWGF